MTKAKKKFKEGLEILKRDVAIVVSSRCPLPSSLDPTRKLFVSLKGLFGPDPFPHFYNII